ncbi:MAG: gamma carbonic anhydrase family protein [Bacteroidetes bacterium]|nr:gamma carbonic anhydrase family protein [Bacteroidota bacterium]
MALIKTVRGYTPVFGTDCFLAETSVILGEVLMGNRCTVWYNAVVRGDVNRITIGDRSNIQDGVVIHGTYQKNATLIGSDVSIGHNAIVHGCIIEDRVLIGMGAIVMDTAVIETGSMVAAGAVVLQGTRVSAGMLYAGVPAKPIRKIDTELLEMIDRTARNYPVYADWFREGEK